MIQSKSWRSFWSSAWLGWKISSNWTDPFLFAVYSIVRPISSALILVVMYSVITQGNFDSPIFAYLYLGNAFYQYVGTVATGVSWAVIDDREHYGTLKYAYIAPLNIPLYLLGRGLVGFATGSVSILITILAGLLFLHLRIDWGQVNWGLFTISLLVGIVMLGMLGLILAGLTLVMARHQYMVGDAVASALFLFSGAIFPLEVLPAFLRPVGYALPVTYWLELLRRALVGQVAQAFPTFAGVSSLNLLLILCAMTGVCAVLAWLTFRYCDHLAREGGLIDMLTNY